MNETAKKYAFVLGREQEICLEELKSVFGRFCFCLDIFRISGNVVFANIDNFTINDTAMIMNALAGTIKIYELVDSLGNNISVQIANLILQKKAGSEGKINFGVSCFNKKLSGQQINTFALTAKKKLKGKFSLRYVESRESAEISSILTLKNNLADKGIEFGIFDEEIGVLIALNNPEEWNKRDYDKPASDKYSGMVPPKLARMMVNIALEESAKISNSKFLISNQCLNDKFINNKTTIKNLKLINKNSNNYVVVDPFCGSGNILMEAMMLGCDVIGSDLSAKAVEDSRKNCDWLKNQISDNSRQITVFQADATSDSFIENCHRLLRGPESKRDKLKIVNYDNVAIVAEPYLGEPKKFKTSFNATVGEYAKIKDIYLNFLKNITSSSSSGLTRGSSLDSRLRGNDNKERGNDNKERGNDRSVVLCLIFPLIEITDQGQFSLYKECVDEIKNLGYTQVRPAMTYGRDYQVVKREIVLLQSKQKNNQ